MEILDFETATTQTLEQLMRDLPEEKYQAGLVMVEEYENMKAVKGLLAMMKAKAFLKADGTSATERNAYVAAHDSVAAQEVELIKAEGAFKRAELYYQSLEDKFTAARKIASLRMEMEKQT